MAVLENLQANMKVLAVHSKSEVGADLKTKTAANLLKQKQ